MKLTKTFQMTEINEIIRDCRDYGLTLRHAAQDVATEMLPDEETLFQFVRRDGVVLFATVFEFVIDGIIEMYENGTIIAAVLIEMWLDQKLPRFRITGIDVAGGTHVLEDIDYNENI